MRLANLRAVSVRFFVRSLLFDVRWCLSCFITSQGALFTAVQHASRITGRRACALPLRLAVSCEEERTIGVFGFH